MEASVPFVVIYMERETVGEGDGPSKGSLSFQEKLLEKKMLELQSQAQALDGAGHYQQARKLGEKIEFLRKPGRLQPRPLARGRGRVSRRSRSCPTWPRWPRPALGRAVGPRRSSSRTQRSSPLRGRSRSRRSGAPGELQQGVGRERGRSGPPPYWERIAPEEYGYGRNHDGKAAFTVCAYDDRPVSGQTKVQFHQYGRKHTVGTLTVMDDLGELAELIDDLTEPHGLLAGA